MHPFNLGAYIIVYGVFLEKYMIIHTVKNGETVYSISNYYGVSSELTVINNGLSGLEEKLPEGLSIVILRPSKTYTVSQNDTTRAIAFKNGITLNTLYRNNLILNGNDLIFPGQTLVIEYDEAPIFDYAIGGYAYTNIAEAVLNETLPFMKLFMPFTYGFNENAEIIELNDDIILSRLFHYGAGEAFFHLSTLTENGSFSNTLSSYLLADESLWSILADNVIKIMEEKGYSGLDIDFEFLNSSDRYIYPTFISYMRERVNQTGRKLIVAVPPKTSSDQPGQLYEGIDYKLIGEAADYILVMSYEWGYSFGPPLPVSPLPSIRRVFDYAVTEIPPEKIFMGISNYGYDWKLPYVSGESKAVSLSNVDSVRLASETGSQILYSGEYEAPYFYYTDSDNAVHEVWFEDARSIFAKLKLIDEYSLHGGLYWNMNRENPQNLSVLSSVMKYVQ